MEPNEFIEKYEGDLLESKLSFEKITSILENLHERITLMEAEAEPVKKDDEEVEKKKEAEDEEEPEDDDKKEAVDKKEEEEEKPEAPAEKKGDDEEPKKKDEPQKPKMEKQSFVGYEMASANTADNFEGTLKEYFKK